MKSFRYKNILLFGSHQWCGNIEEYFSKNTEKLVVFIVMPRVQNENNLVRLYINGNLKSEKKIQLNSNIFLYYFLWYINYLRILFTYFNSAEKITVISFHPHHYPGMSIQRLFRKLTFVFWVGDYFPPLNLTLRMFEKVKKYYHDSSEFACYLGDGVNERLNGKVIQTVTRKTIMWGVDPKAGSKKTPNNTLLYVGVIRHQTTGLEIVYEFLSKNKSYNLNVIGVCDEESYRQEYQLIKKYKIEDRVYFPNKFFPDEDLEIIAKKCFVGLALYTTEDTNVIYYSDPGKVKTYAELGLPVIITNTSSIIPYIRKFKSGEITQRNPEALGVAIQKIKNNYKVYQDGLNKFNNFFNYEKYYGERFTFLEKK